MHGNSELERGRRQHDVSQADEKHFKDILLRRRRGRGWTGLAGGWGGGWGVGRTNEGTHIVQQSLEGGPVILGVVRQLALVAVHVAVVPSAIEPSLKVGPALLDSNNV